MWCTLPGHVPLVLFGLPSCGPLGGSLHLVDAGLSLWSLLNTLCASLYQSVLVTGCVWFDNCAVWLGVFLAVMYIHIPAVITLDFEHLPE